MVWQRAALLAIVSLSKRTTAKSTHSALRTLYNPPTHTSQFGYIPKRSGVATYHKRECLVLLWRVNRCPAEGGLAGCCDESGGWGRQRLARRLRSSLTGRSQFAGLARRP